MARTGCVGVAVGRGCQGRPWLFHDLAAHLHGSDARFRPSLREVARIIMRHAELSIEHFNGDEHRALRELRKHMAWYLRGFAVGGGARNELALVSTLDELRARLAQLDLDQAYPEAAEGPVAAQDPRSDPHLPGRLARFAGALRCSACEDFTGGGWHFWWIMVPCTSSTARRSRAVDTRARQESEPYGVRT